MQYSNISKEFNPGILAPNYLTRRGLLKAVDKYAPTLQGKLMDLGCGSKPYRSLFHVQEYIGVDYDSAGHSHENEQIDVLYDGKNIPFEDGCIESVFTSEVFEHIFNLEQILNEIHRVMQPGAKILMTCPFAICEHEAPNDFARYSSFALKFLFEQHGFEIIEQEKIGNSVTTVFQLWIMYIHQHITPKIQKIPILRSIFRTVTYGGCNILALFFAKIFPVGKDLYLNNVVLARKKTS